MLNLEMCWGIKKKEKKTKKKRPVTSKTIVARNKKKHSDAYGQSDISPPEGTGEKRVATKNRCLPKKKGTMRLCRGDRKDATHKEGF